MQTMLLARSWRFLLLLLVGVYLSFLCLSYADQVTFQWDANVEPDLAGYKLHWGPKSSQYENTVDLGNVTEYTLDIPIDTYVAATAYDIRGLESGYSNECLYGIIAAIAPATDGSIYYEKISMADLFTDNFDDVDGTNLSTRAGWAGSDTDDIEIDTAQKQAGTASVKRNGTDNEACYIIFTKQTSGKHTYDFYYRTSFIILTECEFFGISDGAIAWPDNYAFWFGQDEDDFSYYIGGVWNVFAEGACAVDTWYHFEVEVDIDSATFDIWLDNIKVLTDAPFHNNNPPTTDIDRFTMSDSTDGHDTWIDELRIYEGARAAGQIYELSASISGATGVATPDLDILRALSGAIGAGSATPDTITLKLLKELSANIQAGTATPDDIALLIIKALSASIQAGTATPDDVALLIIKVFSANVQAGTATPDNITLALLRTLTASIQGASDTSAATVAVLRAISAAITTQSQTPDDVDLLIAGILEFSAAISAASAAPDTVVLGVLRELSASIASVSTAPDDADLVILREISANIQAGSATPDDIALLIIRMLSASIQPSTDTATIALGILREISAAIASGSSTPEAMLSVMRGLSATIAPETVTSAITLITAGLGVIVDAVIESLTAKRTITSLAVDRDLGSLTPERTIEKI